MSREACTANVLDWNIIKASTAPPLPSKIQDSTPHHPPAVDMFFKPIITLTAFATNALASYQASTIVPNVSWTVKSLFRDCTPLTLPTPFCSYDFVISTGTAVDFACHLNDFGTLINGTLSNPRTNSFANLGCNAHAGDSGGWYISWGYNNATGLDSTVMTVVNMPANRNAWFGWNYVNNRTQFETVGPNPVYTVGSFT